MIKPFVVMAVMALPGYVVLRSLSVDDGSLVDHACAAIVSLALAALWAKLMAK